MKNLAMTALDDLNLRLAAMVLRFLLEVFAAGRAKFMRYKKVGL